MADIKNKLKKQSIGVFDSGVGGLSVLLELKRILPHENFVFLADQKYVPYGEKSKSVLVKRVYKIADYFQKYYEIKMMVVACNTATVYTIDELRAKYSFPIVATVPAIKPASQKTKSGTVAIISTPATSQSKSLKDLINNYSKNLEVLNVGCPHLEDLVEQGMLNGALVDKLLLTYLEKIKDSNADYLVLGCTHYPFLRKAIAKVLGGKMNILDSGEAIAKQTEKVLNVNKMKNRQKNKGKISYVTTGDPAKFTKVGSELLKSKIKTKKVTI